MLPSCDLPGDVMVNILLKLPVKTLSRFRAVCKSWYFFLNSTGFIQMHLCQPTCEKLLTQCLGSENFLMIYDGNNNSDLSPFPFNSDEKVCLEDSCNGLVCLSSIDHPEIILWNPATQDYRCIGLPCFGSLFDDCPSIGLGFVPENSEYKILMISLTPTKRFIIKAMDMWIYSLRSDCWKKLDILPYELLLLGPPKFTNGCMHYIRVDETLRVSVIAFDLRSELLQCFGVPFSSKFSSGTYIQLADILKSLSIVISLHTEGFNKLFEVWVMTEHGVENSWTKQYVVGPFSSLTRPVGSWKDGKLLFVDYLENGVLFSYDIFTKMRDFLYSRCVCSPYLHYVESLASVHSERRITQETSASDRMTWSSCSLEQENYASRFKVIDMRNCMHSRLGYI